MRAIKPKQDEYMTGIGPSKKKGKSKPIYPSFRLDLEHIPEAKKWDLGKEYSIELKVKLVGLSQSRFDNSADFEILGIEPEGEDDADDKDEKE